MERMRIAADLCRSGSAERQRSHRVRLGAHHPGYEDLRLYRAERRLLLQEPAGRSWTPRHLDNYKDIAAQNVGAALIVTGTRGADARTPSSRLELKAAVHRRWRARPRRTIPCRRSATAWSSCAPSQHLRPRTNLFSAAFRVRSVAAYAIHEFFQEPGLCLCAHPHHHRQRLRGRRRDVPGDHPGSEQPVPKTEDGQVDYTQDFFGKPTNLTVSGQLNAENFAMAFGNVYTFGPTFRAENSNTQRHAAEFWMIEPEMAFCRPGRRHGRGRGHDQVYHPLRAWSSCPQEMEFFNSFVDKGLLERLEHVASSDFGRVSYTEAVEILKKNNDKFDYQGVLGLRPPDRARALPHRAGLQEARCSSPTIPRRSRRSICA